MREVIIEVAVKIVFAIISALISIAFAYITKKMANNQKLKSVSLAKEELFDAVEKVVGELQQTVVGKLKADSADGKLTADEIKSLGEMLIEKVVPELSIPCTKVLESCGMDIISMIHSYAEFVIDNNHFGVIDNNSFVENG